MQEPPKDYDKDIELHESEWAKEGKKQPIFGPGAGWFFQVVLPVLVIGVVLSQVAKFIWRALLGY